MQKNADQRNHRAANFLCQKKYLAGIICNLIYTLSKNVLKIFIGLCLKQIELVLEMHRKNFLVISGKEFYVFLFMP